MTFLCKIQMFHASLWPQVMEVIKKVDYLSGGNAILT